MEYKISELVEINKRSIRKEDSITEIQYLDTSNLTEGMVDEVANYNLEKDKVPSRARRKVKKNDILISTVRPNQKHYGIINEKQEDYIVSTGFAVLSPNEEKVDPYFLYKYLTLDDITETLQSIAENSTSAYPSIRPSVIGDLTIKLPDLKVQKRLGSFFRTIDEKIQINNEIINNLEQLAQTLFKHWFIDFEFPNENGEPYKSSGGEMVKSELGMIPKGWTLKKLSKVVIHSKKSFNPQKSEPIEVAHFSLPAFDQQEYPVIENSGAIKSNKYYIDEYSVLFSRMNPNTPRTWLPNIIDNLPNICSSEFIVLDTSLKDNKYFIYSLTTSDDFTNFLINNATGSTNSRQRVTPTIALAYCFPYNEDTVHKYNENLQSIYDKILLLREEKRVLANLRDTLLPKLLSGEIELPDEIEVIEDVPIS